MDALQARVNSFKKSKRVKNASKPSSTTTLKWPHPPGFRANPESLAEAGFYYDPSYDDPDNVTCYVCEKELGGWEEDDDPFLIHWTKCGQTCCWASARCGLMSDLDRKGRFISTDNTRIPTHKSMEKARHETYSVGKGWIHDKIANHGANSKMMARAGFVYTPQHNGDDLATCFYCNTSLSGWDAEDDPLEEHRKRDNKTEFPCPFFAASPSEIASSTKPVSRVQSTKPPSKSQAKPPSRSASRSKHQDIVQATKTFDGEDEDESDAPPPDVGQLTAKTPGKGRSTSSSSTRKSSAKTPKNKTRSSSRSGLKNVVEEDDEDEEDEEEAPPEPQSAAVKKSRSRSKSVVRSEFDDPTEPAGDEPVIRKPSRSRTKKVVSDAEGDVPRKSSRSKSKASIAPPATERKPSRIKSKSKAVDSEQEEIPPATTKTRHKSKAVESEQEENPPVTAKPKHKRTASRAKSKAPVEASEVDSEHEPDIPEPAPKKKSAAKSKPPQAPAAQDLFDDDVFTDHYVPPPVSPPPATKQSPVIELPPLLVPKRSTTKNIPTPSESVAEAPPVQKEKKKPGKPKAKPPPPSRSRQSDDEEVVEEELRPVKPVVIVSTNPSPLPPPKDKPADKPKLASGSTHVTGKQKLRVVEISSDEEPEEEEKTRDKPVPLQDKEKSSNISKSQLFAPPTPQAVAVQPAPPPNPVSAQTKRGKKTVIIETVQPIKAPRTPSPKPPSPLVDADVSMEYVDPEDSNKMQDVPITPPRPTLQTTTSEEEVQLAVAPAETKSDLSEPPFIPALSKLPFTPLNTLSEPELDMTVEEWIRYQMDVEFDKFKRDGERELQRFRKRADEVRKVIEGL